MKLFNIILIFIIFSSCSEINNKEPDTSDRNLRGNVKSIREYSYKAVVKFGKTQKAERKINEVGYHDEHVIFNRNGDFIEINSYNSRGELTKKEIYKYDDNNNIEINIYNPDGSLKEKVIDKYDASWNFIESSTYLPDGSLLSNYFFKYINNGEIIEASFYSGTILTYKCFDKYDSNGNSIESGTLNEYNIYMVNKSKYDDKGNVIEWNYYDDGDSIIMKISYKYDNKNNLIVSNEYNDDGSISSKYIYKYEYDVMGNWINKIEIKNNTALYIIERKIEYFN